MTREHDYPQPTTELADQLEQAARDLTDSALTLRNSHPGRERLIALASAYTLLTGLWRATLRDRIRGQIDVEKRRQATSWSTVARLLATAGVPLSASQLRQCTIARTGGGQAARRRRDVARRLNPDDLQAWLLEGFSYAEIARRQGVSPQTVARHADANGLAHLNTRGAAKAGPAPTTPSEGPT